MVPVSTSPLPLLMPPVLSSALRHRLQMKLKDSFLFSFSSRRRFCRCSVNSTRLYWVWRERASRDKRERHWPRPCSRSSRREPIQPSHIRVEVSTKVWNTLQTMTFPLRQRRNSSQILFYRSLDGDNFRTSLSPAWVCHISRGSISPLGVRLSHTHTPANASHRSGRLSVRSRACLGRTGSCL
jgi:hypothetical protein